MADSITNFDFSDSQQDMLDNMYSDVNFNEDSDPFQGVDLNTDIDAEFEDRLALDFPAGKVQAPEVPASSMQQPDALDSCAPEPSKNEVYSQFINPQLTVTHPINTVPRIPSFGNLGMGWPNSQQADGLLTYNPAILAQPQGNQMCAPYVPMGTQFLGQQMYQQPIITQTNGQPMVYGQFQQPIGLQMSGQQIVHQQSASPVQQVSRAPQRRSSPQTNPQMPPLPAMPLPMDPSMPPRPINYLSQPIINRSHPSPPLPYFPLDFSRHSKQPPSPGTETTRPPPKRPTKNHLGEPLLNDKIPRRTHTKKGNSDVEPERYYGPSPKKPDSWGPRDEKGRYLFTYTDKGELTPGKLFTSHQMRQYLLGPQPNDTFDPPGRLPGVKHLRKKFRQGLTLWIGWPAAMANSRYPRGGESTKCRFRNCQYRHTIALGEPWVIFDERQNIDGELVNPFHNAGFVHLFCLEYHFDIIHLWHLVDIRPDYRTFKRESHPYFCLEHKLPYIDEELRTWWMAEYEVWAQRRMYGERRIRTFENSLTQCLINFKLDHEPKAQTRNRQKRGGADMSKHRGNPELKRKFLLYKKYGLLDDQGFPIAEAAATLQEIENMQRANSRFGNYPDVQPTQPVHNTEPRYLNQSPQVPNVPDTPGRKRGLDETAQPSGGASENPTVIGEPSPKRQKLENTAPTPTSAFEESTYSTTYVDHGTMEA
ncbi:hypothetical protein GQX73_g4974 [Xylaria multiplex]|uniref:Uncharacterized protein n=1 Tax=Xylaria multiplex TaxID=323545 RepID=A0A7C8MUV3_9PEZI|nr:hypothetical protein GQX73_g4974 [Xylaria multiplex]